MQTDKKKASSSQKKKKEGGDFSNRGNHGSGKKKNNSLGNKRPGGNSYKGSLVKTWKGYGAGEYEWIIPMDQMKRIHAKAKTRERLQEGPRLLLCLSVSQTEG